MNSIVKRIVTALFTASVVVLAIIYAPLEAMLPVVVMLFVAAAFEYAQLLAKRLSLGSASGVMALLAGWLVLAGSLSVLPLIAYKHGNLMLLYVIALVKFSDMGGFALGMSLGKHKLCPTISPKKSWEGLFGSVLAATLLSLAFMPITKFSPQHSVAIGVVAALVGTLGDLIESKLKRWAGVKDSATFMPAGLGGFLDMLDSLLLAPAVIWALI